MNKVLTTLIAASAVSWATQEASAVQIAGGITVVAQVPQNLGDLTLPQVINLGPAFGIDFINPPSGDFASALTVTSHFTPLSINPTGPATPFVVWTLSNGFQLTLNSFVELPGNTADKIELGGAGTITDVNGPTNGSYDPTSGNYSLSITKTRSGAQIQVGFTSTATSDYDPTTVPDGGATAMLLGMGAIAMGAVARRKS